MTDSQLGNNLHGGSTTISTISNHFRYHYHNNNSNSNNNNVDREQKYLHKKFKKMAKSETIVSNNHSVEVKEGYSADVILEGSSTTDKSIEARKSVYVCSYCKIICAKPSVLQKHIRAHTNERPYPCAPCGFAFKTKSNLYKHCKSRAHSLKMDGVDVSKVLQSSVPCSEESDLSLSDSTSNDTVTPSPPISTLLLADSQEIFQLPNNNSHYGTKIYKPKFHTTFPRTFSNIPSNANLDILQKEIERIITNNQAIEHEPLIYKVSEQPVMVESDNNSIPNLLTRKRRHSEGSTNSLTCSNCGSSYGSFNNLDLHRKFSCKNVSFTLHSTDLPLDAQPLPSPGPLLGTTRLIDAPLCRHSQASEFRLSALNMFGGEMQIVECNNKNSMKHNHNSVEKQSDQYVRCSESETTSIVVRSSLHSGGIMLHKPSSESVVELATSLRLGNIAPLISPPSLAPSLPYFDYIKSENIPAANKTTAYVTRMSEKQSLKSVKPSQNLELITANTLTTSTELTLLTSSNLAVRPSSLSLKLETFTPKLNCEFTSSNNTLTLVSPETPRPRKSYGQLYLNGHAYTYLGLKCSTRLFYCTLNRTQPMYVTQQQGLSMYSNWKICLEACPEMELVHYDSRQRLVGYTLAGMWQDGILTHSSQRPNTPCSTDSSLECDSTERAGRVRIFEGGFESNEDYTYIRGRGRGRYVCEVCGIRCKKPSMLKKHIRTHTDVRPYTCGHCVFSFKTKGNLTKHMKSKTHYKKCLELQIMPLPIAAQDKNVDQEDVARFLLTDRGPNEETSEEDESEIECDDSEDEGSEGHEIRQSLLNVAGLNDCYKLTGLLPQARPITYPYKFSEIFSQRQAPKRQQLTVSHSSFREEPVTPIDLTVSRQHQEMLINDNNLVVTKAACPRVSQIIEYQSVPGQDQSSVEVIDKSRVQAYLTERSVVDKRPKQQYCMSTKEEIKEVSSFTKTAFDGNCSGSEQQKNPIVSRLCKTSEAELLQQSEQPNLSRLVSGEVIGFERVLIRQQALPPLARKVVVGGPDFKSISPFNSVACTSKSNVLQRTSSSATSFVSLAEDNHNICGICSKVFSKPSQLRLHINIHYFERPFKCESCGTSFRTKGHLTKHERSTLHHNKVIMADDEAWTSGESEPEERKPDDEETYGIDLKDLEDVESKIKFIKTRSFSINKGFQRYL